MKRLTKAIALAILTATLLAGCKGKNPVAGKKMALNVGGMSVVYIFEKEKFYMEGLDGIKMKYRYDKDSDSIIYTELDGTESVIEMSKLKEVK